MSTEIDLHVLCLKERDLKIVKRAIDSALVAIRNSPIPIHFHIVQGIPGHIGASRYLGYGQGCSPWVMHFDDDDVLHPDAFVEIAQVIEKDASLDYITAYEECWNYGVLQRSQRHSHGFECFRRAHLIDHRDFRYFSDEAQRRAKRIQKKHVIPKYLYTYYYQRRYGRCINELIDVRNREDFVYLEGVKDE